MALPGNDLLSQIENASDISELRVKLGTYLRRYLGPAIETTASNAAVSPVSQIPAPAPPESVAISQSGEYLHVQINHTAPIQKGARYITTIATNPQFTNAPIIKDHASRAPEPFFLPTKTSAAVTQQYHVAVQVQYPGSPPSAPTYYGGAAPTPITMSGSTEMDLLPGTGSGTAQNGGQALVGLGKTQIRLGSQ